MASIITDVGETKLASATPLDQVTITDIAVGDGNGGYPPLLSSMTELSNEVWRGSASEPIRDSENDNILIFEGFIPANIGGFDIREMAIFDDEGDMIAIGHTSLIEKPVPGTGSGLSLSIRLHVAFESSEQVDLIFQDQGFIDHQGLTNRGASDAHPAGSISTEALSALSQPGSDVQSILSLLKTAATKAAVSDPQDTTADRALLAGSYGMGRALRNYSLSDDDLDGFQTPGAMAVWSGDSVNRPDVNHSFVVEVSGGSSTETAGALANRLIQTATRYQNGSLSQYRRSFDGSTWSDWIIALDQTVGWGDQPKVLSGSSYDIDDYLTPGNYFFGPSALNRPGSGSYKIIVFGGRDGAGPYLSQIAHQTSGGELYIRSYVSGWSSWKRIYTEENTDMVGSIHVFATTVAPDGFLKANGAEVSRTAYENLFNKVGTFWGVGDGSTTFNLPDLRGEFMRYWDDGRGIDSGRSFGSSQVATTLSMVDDGANTSSRYLQSVSGADETTVSSTTTARDFPANATYDRTLYSVRPRNVALLAYIKY